MFELILQERILILQSLLVGNTSLQRKYQQ
jgi:hypothetical protein